MTGAGVAASPCNPTINMSFLPMAPVSPAAVTPLVSALLLCMAGKFAPMVVSKLLLVAGVMSPGCWPLVKTIVAEIVLKALGAYKVTWQVTDSLSWILEEPSETEVCDVVFWALGCMSMGSFS